jgi:acyl carrier protein
MSEALVEELKRLVIEALHLEDITPADIDPAKPLFNEGLGLDSIDALELGVALQKKYGLRFDANAEETRKVFGSINALAAFVQANRKQD